VRIEEATLEHLYEYDWAMIDYVITLEKCITDLRSVIDGRNEAGIKAQLGAIRARLADFDRSFDERIERSAGIFNF